MPEAQFLRPNKKKLEAIKSAVSTYATANDYSQEELNKLLDSLDRRPLVRFFVIRAVEDEMRAEGINWDAIGDFLVKIAPIIIEIIKMFF